MTSKREEKKKEGAVERNKNNPGLLTRARERTGASLCGGDLSGLISCSAGHVAPGPVFPRTLCRARKMLATEDYCAASFFFLRKFSVLVEGETPWELKRGGARNGIFLVPEDDGG